MHILFYQDTKPCTKFRDKYLFINKKTKSLKY